MSGRRMGCVSATEWFLKRVNGYHAKRLQRFTEDGKIFEHVVVESNDYKLRIDLAPYVDNPSL